jgi:hypothetical protein
LSARALGQCGNIGGRNIGGRNIGGSNSENMGDSEISNTITTVESSVLAGRRTSVCSRQEFHA